jgi:orotate phosphoribosyltransferase
MLLTDRVASRPPARLQPKGRDRARLGPMDKQTLAVRVNDCCRLEGTFTLRSGKVASHYFDKYLFEGDPELLRAVVAHAVRLVPPDTEVLAGLELGGVPIATALSLETGLPAAFVRKAAKAYGTAKLAEGGDVANRRVLVVEDVITTGGQVVTSTEDLRHLGAKVEHVLCVIDRSGGQHDALDAAGLTVSAVLTAAELDAAAAGTTELRPLHPNARRVQERLGAAGLSTRVVEVESSVRTAHEAASSLGVEVGQIVKSLVFEADGEPVLLLVAGDHRVDPVKAARVLGVTTLRMADVELVRASTGFPIGGVAPVGHPRPIRTVVDQSLGRFEVLWAAAGTPNTVFPSSLDELLALAEGSVADIG